jgi:hypothetical protein
MRSCALADGMNTKYKTGSDDVPHVPRLLPRFPWRSSAVPASQRIPSRARILWDCELISRTHETLQYVTVVKAAQFWNLLRRRLNSHDHKTSNAGARIYHELRALPMIKITSNFCLFRFLIGAGMHNAPSLLFSLGASYRLDDAH